MKTELQKNVTYNCPYCNSEIENFYVSTSLRAYVKPNKIIVISYDDQIVGNIDPTFLCPYCGKDILMDLETIEIERNDF